VTVLVPVELRIWVVCTVMVVAGGVTVTVVRIGMVLVEVWVLE
jgi:hypothetical protein